VVERGRGAVFLGTADFFATVGAGVFSGVMESDTLPDRRTAYGSAVAGLLISGRRIGRRTVPDINDPVPVEFFNADLVDSPDMAEGGRAGPEDPEDKFEAVLDPRFFDDCDDCDVTGE
jgi:hypothetical protein